MPITVDRKLNPDFLTEFREIFFLCSSKKTFGSEREKQGFFHRWAGYYLESFPDDIYLARNQQNDLLGYLTGCKNTFEARSFLRIENHCHLAFESRFTAFPAHFHVNVHPHYQGQGVGAVLLQSFFSDLKRNNVPGVHLITSADSDNITFYRKQGFEDIESKVCGSMDLSFLGRKL